MSKSQIMNLIKQKTNNKKLHKNDFISSIDGFIKLIQEYSFDIVLDIGSGQGVHASILTDIGKRVDTVDFGTSFYAKKRENSISYIGNYLDIKFPKQYDCIIANHILEHQPNPNLFLKKIFNDLKTNGILLITVPPLKHQIVGGHVTLWNAGLLLYNLILAGFDCSKAKCKEYGYNISIILQKQKYF